MGAGGRVGFYGSLTNSFSCQETRGTTPGMVCMVQAMEVLQRGPGKTQEAPQAQVSGRRRVAQVSGRRRVELPIAQWQWEHQLHGGRGLCLNPSAQGHHVACWFGYHPWQGSCLRLISCHPNCTCVELCGFLIKALLLKSDASARAHCSLEMGRVSALEWLDATTAAGVRGVQNQRQAPQQVVTSSPEGVGRRSCRTS